MSIAEKLLTIAENEQRVYDAGFKAGQSQGGDTEVAYKEGEKAMWDVITNNQQRTDYNRVCFCWGDEYIRPPYKIVPTGSMSGQYTFASNSNLKRIEKEYFDFSQKEQAANSNGNWSYMFSYCTNLEVVEDIGLNPQWGYAATFRGCGKLHTIERLGVDEKMVWDKNVFQFCSSLVNLTIDGTIGQNGFDIHWSTKLSKESLLSILGACNIDVTASPVTITLPSKCIDGATDTKTLLEGLGGKIEYMQHFETSTNIIQLNHTNIKPNSVLLVPMWNMNGVWEQCNPEIEDDGQGNLTKVDYIPEYSDFGTINYETGLITTSDGVGSDDFSMTYKIRYTAESPYTKALANGYKIEFA